MLSMANVSFPAWQAVFLILLSFGSLIIALYCLFFMVPLKKFVQRIESLGGGMEGIKRHLSGVEDYLEKELKRIESTQADRIDDIKTETGQRTRDVEQKMQDLTDTVGRLELLCSELKQTAQETRELNEKNAHSCETLENRLRELQRDLSVLTEETKATMQKEVGEAFRELEAVVLATLEVLRDELMAPEKNHAQQDRAVPLHRERQKNGPHKNRDAPSESKIISAGPLFSRAEKASSRNKDDKKPGDESEPDT